MTLSIEIIFVKADLTIEIIIFNLSPFYLILVDICRTHLEYYSVEKNGKTKKQENATNNNSAVYVDDTAVHQ